MRSAAAWITLVGIAVALGGLITSVMVVMPALGGVEGVDPNLARVWVAPMGLRLAELVLGGCVAAALAGPRWLHSAAAGTLGLAAAALAIVDRAVVLPRLVDGWSTVDLATSLPAANMATVDTLARGHQAAAATIAVLLACTVALAVRRIDSEAGAPGSIPTPTPA